VRSELKVAFPFITPVQRPKVEDQKIEDPNWLAGFTSGVRSGCFLVNIAKNSKYNTGFLPAQLEEFKLTQHSRDVKLMESLIKFWDCGNCSQPLDYHSNVDFRIQKFSDLHDKVIPF
jgi:hypothetical protein